MKWLKIKELYEYFSLLTIFKYVSTPNVPFFNESFYVNEANTLRNNRIVCYVNPKNNFGLSMFQYTAKRLWCQVIPKIAYVNSMYSFKSNLKKYFNEIYA